MIVMILVIILTIVFFLSVKYTPLIIETNNKPINLFYNTTPIEYRNGNVYNSLTHEIFKSRVRLVAVELGTDVPYELKVTSPYTMLRVTKGPYENHSKQKNLYVSDKHLHPGEKFVVKEPFSVVLINMKN